MSIDEFLAFVDDRLPPAPKKELARLESELSCRLPADYRSFLLACNGGSVGGRLWFRGPAPDGRPVDVGVHHVGGFRSESYLSIFDTRYLYGSRIPSPLLWIMDDPFGNAICLAVRGDHKGHVFFWDHEDEPDPRAWDGRMETAGNIRLVAHSFTDFVGGLSQSDDA